MIKTTQTTGPNHTARLEQSQVGLWSKKFFFLNAASFVLGLNQLLGVFSFLFLFQLSHF